MIGRTFAMGMGMSTMRGVSRIVSNMRCNWHFRKEETREREQERHSNHGVVRCLQGATECRRVQYEYNAVYKMHTATHAS